ncbi:hypothetical protein M501DRAFT_993496 [Patellaria atrata CBS 101060]|uniref:Serine-threonine protein kinase 19 n=1 Tax=Patellaria atrata CBS 101060 TaxID=1346257 RepID=A0A9P4SI36_9PEZI|nr:hypothetical protein M501DRAFT_993496 [Patellaria atrata CBS 101060]
MVFLTTGAHSSRVTKSRVKPSFLRRTSSAFSTTPRRKPSTSTPTSKKPKKAPLPDDDDDDFLSGDRLDDTGFPHALSTDLSLRDVPQLLLHTQSKMFDPLPTPAGMSSTRIAEVLQFRARMPPIVSVAHIHALASSPTATERETAQLIQKGILRRIRIEGRVNGAADVGEGIVLTSAWESRVRSARELDGGVKERYIALLRAHPTSTTLPGRELRQEDAAALTSAGFLTRTQPRSAAADVLSAPSAAGTSSTLASLATAGSKAAAGTVEAVGGVGAVLASGAGGVRGLASRDRRAEGEFNFALPATGAYLKLLAAARAHLVSLLEKTSRWREAPVSVLRERWEGGVAGDDVAAAEKRERGWTGVLPGRTRKWRSFWGCGFEWVLEECVGAGLVECFETGSVGVGVRVVR